MSANDDQPKGTEVVRSLGKNPLAGLMNNPEILAMMQAKLAGMEGQMSGYYETLPEVVKRRVRALKNIQVDVLKIEAEYAVALHELDMKFAPKFDALYGKRTKVVTGEYEPNDEECDFPSDEEEEEEETEKKTNGNSDVKKEPEEKAAHGMDENTKGIPEFWLTIFKNVELIAANIQDHDEPILAHLIDIQVKYSSKPMGYTLEFYFSPNDYFTNSVLTKYYELKCEVDPEDPFSFEGAEVGKATGCEISWKKGKNVTVRAITKKQKHKAKGNMRTVEKQVPTDSWFNFFSPPVPEGDDDVENEEIEATLAADYEMGEVIRSRLIQRAVLYFTGEALDDEDYDEEEEDDDEEDDEEYDEEEDEDFAPPKAPKGKGGKNPEECKQQ